MRTFYYSLFIFMLLFVVRYFIVGKVLLQMDNNVDF